MVKHPLQIYKWGDILMERKICTKCGKEKVISEFVKDKYTKSGYTSDCKECRKVKGINYSKTHRKQINEYRKRYRKQNLNKVRKQEQDARKRLPWLYTLSDIRKRCENKNCKRYKDYGGRGIKCLITSKELKELWFRDKAYLMKKPSIDRIDNDGNYCFDNCQYIELKINSGKNKYKPVLQFTKDGIFIREWNSITEVNKTLKISNSDISTVIHKGFKGKYQLKTAGGYIWKLKE